MDFTQAQYDAIVLAERVFEFGVIGIALWRGDQAMRAVTLLFLVQAVGVPVAEFISPTTSPTKAYLLVDGPILVALLALTARVRRRWLLWTCAFKLMVAANHVAYTLDQRIEPLAYATAANIWTLLSYSTLLVATVGASRRAARAEPTP